MLPSLITLYLFPRVYLKHLLTKSMNLFFNQELGKNYRSLSQKIRVMSESWLASEMYCMACGDNLQPLKNNTPASDMYCAGCGARYELKSARTQLGHTINDGAYAMMIKRIMDGTLPSFFYLTYATNEFKVTDLVYIPRYFISRDYIVKRQPLSVLARRAGWTGCKIDISSIPAAGKMSIIRNGKIEQKKKVLARAKKISFLGNVRQNNRGWLLDILKCVEMIGKINFTLEEMYSFENFLRLKYPENNNIKAKIRQQLQLLRDGGYLSFERPGEYILL